LGKLADRKAVRKHLFVIFGSLVALLCVMIGVSLYSPFIALLFFVLMAVSHQQAFVFYNSLLLGFETRGFTSGLGVALGYVGSALALIFLAEHLKEPGVYFVVSVIFIVLLLPSAVLLKNPLPKKKVSLREVFRDRKFLMLIVAILSVTEVANTLVAMMAVYLREVFSMDRLEIYRVIGLSAVGGILGGLLWGRLSDLLGVKRVFPLGFLLWGLFLLTLPFAPKSLILLWGFWAGMSLAHLWTTSRVMILSEFPEGEASVRLSFLSLTERVASTTGLFLWGLLLYITDHDYRLSAVMMAVFPFAGLLLLWYMHRKRLI